MDQRKVFEFIGLIKELEQIQFERDSLDQMFFAKMEKAISNRASLKQIEQLYEI